MKRILKVILCILLLSALSAPSYAAQKPLTVYVDWAQAATDPPPVIINGRTLVPLRQVFEAMGMTVEWDAAARV
ncbi:MAG: hypothetical protein IJ705_07945, partial [Oscillospiraceae bacterium]|nr:hypothetical protein [Oscillospiraceae bacterium]